MYTNDAIRDTRSFNPRTREGCDHTTLTKNSTPYAFQSTHPVKGATVAFASGNSDSGEFQSTHP